MRRRRHCSLIGAAIVIGLALSGCANGAQPTASPSTSSPASSTPTPTSGSPAGSATPTSPSAPPPPSNPAPGRVHGLTAETGGGSGEVLLTWTQNPESDVVYYIVYRAAQAGGHLSQLGTVTRRQVSKFPGEPFVDSAAQHDYYWVRAVDSAGQRGPLSAAVCGEGLGYDGAAPGSHC